MIKPVIKLQELRRRIYAKAKADKQHRFWGLYVHLSKLEVLREAYKQAKDNGGSAGIDGVTFADIEQNGREKFVVEIQQALEGGTYVPSPNRKVEIPKGDGKSTRMLGIPTIRDRVVQGALKLILEPIYETDFQDGSYGYRPGRSQHQAVEWMNGAANHGKVKVIDLDLSAYFDSVRHHILLSKMAERIRDNKVMHLLKQILKAGGKIGVPQGGVISTLMSNIYLNEVDKMLEKAREVTKYKTLTNLEYARFADDIVVMVDGNNKWNLLWVKVWKRLQEELEKIQVKINRDKTRLINLDKGDRFTFLGFEYRKVKTLKGTKRVLIRPSMKSRKKLMSKVKVIFDKHKSQPISRIIAEINPILRGWANYFRGSNAGKTFSYVREWVLMKVRRHLMRAKNRRGFGWKRWSTPLLIKIHEIYNDYEIRNWKVRPAR